jgi:hypothetical protein
LPELLHFDQLQIVPESSNKSVIANIIPGRFEVPLPLDFIFSTLHSPESPGLTKVEDLSFHRSNSEISFCGDPVFAFSDFDPLPWLGCK